ncbi:NmrA family NAD(P)-binding protein [Bacillus sp. NP157]|nr:NmrA family NAD(P)-binding protein [Bacillus sp. NP157]
MSILVIGATGQVGSAVVERLAAAGADVRAMTRNPASYQGPAGVRAVAGDANDPASLRAALQGVDTLFLLSPVAVEELNQGLTVLTLARDAGIQRFVYLSVLNAEHFTDVPHFTVKYTIERMIEQFDLPATVLRPSYFMQNDTALKDVAAQHGVYPMALGDAGIEMVDIRDIADVATAALLRRARAAGPLPREVIEITGPEAITGTSAAATWANELGRDVVYGGSDLDAAEAAIGQNLPAWQAYDLRLMLARFHRDGMRGKPAARGTLRTLLGREPRTYAAFVKETAAR